MLLWYVIAVCFVACALAYHLWQGITWPEAAILFAASGIVFAVHMHYIYKRTTTDEYLVSGYVTSLIHRPPFSYDCGKHRCHEPERWIIEQRPQPATQETKITRSIHGGDGRETCVGECRTHHPAPYSSYACCHGNFYSHSILVNASKFRRTAIGDTSAAWKEYFNPVRVSDDVTYAEKEDIPYFEMSDFNRAHRFKGPGVTGALEQKLEQLNSDMSYRDISAGIVITDDDMFFEKLKRAWHQGKTNDFVVVVTSRDGKTINNVNVLGWHNYNLKENVAGAIMALSSADPDAIFTAVDSALRNGPDFHAMDFKKYKFLSVKIPANYYWRILLFQLVIFAYTLMLLRFNPNTKTYSLPWRDVAKMWKKGYHPPQANWQLHPVTPAGLLLHIGIPVLAATMLWAF